MNQKLNQYVEILSQQNRVLRGLLELTRRRNSISSWVRCASWMDC